MTLGLNFQLMLEGKGWKQKMKMLIQVCFWLSVSKQKASDTDMEYYYAHPSYLTLIKEKEFPALHPFFALFSLSLQFANLTHLKNTEVDMVLESSSHLYEEASYKGKPIFMTLVERNPYFIDTTFNFRRIHSQVRHVTINW